MNQPSVPSRPVQQLIRYTMLGGVALFGVVIAYLRSEGLAGDGDLDPNGSPVAIALSVVVLASGGAIPLIHRLIVGAGSEQRRFQLTLVALALGEAAAFVGGVIWLLTGAWTMYAVGAGIFLVALIWLSPEHGAGEPS